MNKFYSFLYMFCVLIIFAQINSIKITSTIQKSLANIKKESPVDEGNVFLEKNDQINDISTGMNVIQVTSFGVITISDYANIGEFVNKAAWTKCSLLYGNSKYTSNQRDEGFKIGDLIDQLAAKFPQFFSDFDNLVENIKNQAGNDGYQESFLVVRDNFVMAIVNFVKSVKSEEESFKYSELVVSLNNIQQLISHPSITSAAIDELSSFKDLHFGNNVETQNYVTYKQIIEKQKNRHDEEKEREKEKNEALKLKANKKQKKHGKRRGKEEEETTQSIKDDQDEVFLAKGKNDQSNEDQTVLLAKDEEKQATLAKDEENQATLAKEVEVEVEEIENENENDD